jgi:7-cyano-7-deazaguanine synthase in queuosine biosynthesis
MEMEIATVCGVDIEIPDGPIGISVSGGADSVALLYIFLTHFPHKELHVYTAIENTLDFRLAAGPGVSTIIARILQRSQYCNIQHHITQYNNTGSTFDPAKIYETAFNHIDRGIIRSIFSGVTASPPINIAKEWDDDPEMINEMESRLPEQDLPTKMGDIYMPFRNYDKIKIAEIYKTYDLMTWLFPLTFSCEDTSNKLANLVHCGECWWCNERMWAFGKLV